MHQLELGLTCRDLLSKSSLRQLVLKGVFCMILDMAHKMGPSEQSGFIMKKENPADKITSLRREKGLN